jgi:hypothetical protein
MMPRAMFSWDWRSLTWAGGERVRNGAILLFAGEGAIRATGVVVHKLHNRDLALRLWKTDEDGDTWEYMYFVDQVEPCDVPYARFNAVAEYKTNFVIQSFQELEDEKSARNTSSSAEPPHSGSSSMGVTSPIVNVIPSSGTECTKAPSERSKRLTTEESAPGDGASASFELGELGTSPHAVIKPISVSGTPRSAALRPGFRRVCPYRGMVEGDRSLIRPCEESFDNREELPGLLGMWVVPGVGNHHEPRMSQHAGPLFAAGKGQRISVPVYHESRG